MNEELLLAVISVTLLIIILSLVIVFSVINYNRKQEKFLLEKKAMQQEFQKQLMQAQIEMQEHTMTSLGEELHDNIGQLLSSAKLLLNISERNIPQIPESLKTAEETLGKAIGDLRLLSKSLNKEWLHQFNLVENLQAEVERINTSGAIQVKLNCTAPVLPLQTDLQIVLFRIMQEALQNCIKHAKANKIEISLNTHSNKIEATVADNGKGFNVSHLSTGMGILNMQHRAKLLGGVVSWNSGEGQGTKVNIVLPVHNN